MQITQVVMHRALQREMCAAGRGLRTQDYARSSQVRKRKRERDGGREREREREDLKEKERDREMEAD